MSQERTESKITIDDISINYKIAGIGQLILILHGWGSSVERWAKVQDMLGAKGHRVIVLDLPGFGKTPAPGAVWGVQEYAEFVNRFAQNLGLEKFVLVGHSFGGQIAVQFAVTHPEKTEKLVLVAAAAIRHEPGRKAKVLAAIAGVTPRPVKKVVSLTLTRSDYARAQGIMKDIMKKVITQDLSAKLSKIQAPTLIIWGDNDKDTPTEDAHIMHKLIPNSKLEILKGARHRINFEAPDKLAKTIWSWLS
ncbi:MAG TPA: alpha/beta hydrolase [Candidatus Paceibacterota bacterium]